jgi:hypothetical protein
VFLEELDIFLYYFEDKMAHPREFNFVEIDEEGATELEWEVLNKSKQRLLAKFKPDASRSIYIRKSHNREGGEHPRSTKMPIDWSPKVTLVKLVMEEVQR